ncbi:hypothetical protein D3C87_1131480 [compost metagenome]
MAMPITRMASRRWLNSSSRIGRFFAWLAIFDLKISVSRTDKRIHKVIRPINAAITNATRQPQS